MKRMIVLLALVSLACMSTAPIVTAIPSALPVASALPLSTITPRVTARRAPTAPTHFVCADRWLNVRDLPDPFSNVISTLSAGASVTVYETQSGWARIGDDRWVNGKYLCR